MSYPTEVNSSVTRAAALLGLSHQGLAYLIQSRHPDLLKERRSSSPSLSAPHSS